MMNIVTQEQMNGIWSALNAPLGSSRPHRARRIIQEAISYGWFRSHLLEDFIYESDRRLDDIRYGVDPVEFAATLGYCWQNVVRRPRQRSISVVYSKAIPLAGLASLLLDLEALGFNVDPQPIIDHLNVALKTQAVLTDDELSVFWAPKSRGKREISLEVADNDRSYGGYKEGKLSNGYRYFVLFRKDGKPTSLTVTGPRHRRRRKPTETVCSECGYTWYRGDPDSSAAHRAEHRKRMHVLDPQPHEMMLTEMHSSDDPELVTTNSPAWKHLEIYRRAFAFKREEGYDFVQWQGASGDDAPHVHGFLFTNEDGTIKGAAAFRWREPEAPIAPFWGLQWVWICPRYRRTGILAKRWKLLKQRFGDFVIEGPVSESMQAFLAKHGDEQLMRWPSRRGQNAEDIAAS
jgi:hypothetical protein